MCGVMHTGCMATTTWHVPMECNVVTGQAHIADCSLLIQHTSVPSLKNVADGTVRQHRMLSMKSSSLSRHTSPVGSFLADWCFWTYTGVYAIWSQVVNKVLHDVHHVGADVME